MSSTQTDLGEVSYKSRRSPLGIGEADDLLAGEPSSQCLECGAERAGEIQVCARCGAPIGLQQPVAAVPAAGGPGVPVPPLADDAPDGPPGQRTSPADSRRKNLIGVGGAIAIFVALIAAIGVGATSVPSANQLTWDQLQPGDCLAGSNMGLGAGGWWPDYVTQVACTQRHEAEVFFVGDNWPQSMAYPGENELGSQAYVRCAEAFLAYDGTYFWQTPLQIDSIMPGEPDWASGGRSLECLAYEPSSSGPSGGTPVDYSIRGSGRREQ